MKASVESMGGTTLEMMIPFTLWISSPAGSNRLCSRMPHSSAVCSRTVRSLHCEIRSRPSNAPIVMLLLPASRASSTYASCKDQGIRSVIAPHNQVAFGVQAGAGAFDAAFGLIHDDATSGYVAGSAAEQRQNGFFVFAGHGIDRREQRQQNLFARETAAGMNRKRGRLGV